MPRAKSKVETALRQKGFAENQSHHHQFVYTRQDGRLTSIRTKTSHTPKMKDLGDELLGQMAKQAKLDRRTFLELVDCPLSREAYEALLIKKGELP